MNSDRGQGLLFSYCSCYLRSNIYIQSTKCHFKFIHEAQFCSDYKNFIDLRGFNYEDVLKEVKKEVQLRKKHKETAVEQRTIISQKYKFLYHELKSLKVNFLDQAFQDICAQCNSKTEPQNFVHYMEKFLVNDPVFRIYQFPVFTTSFCQMLIKEVENFNGHTEIPKERPNTMNKYGVLLDVLGLQPLFDHLRRIFLNPIAKLLFPDCIEDALDSHRAFTVSYSTDTETSLDFHYDNAEVTLNVSLNDQKDYENGLLYFCGMRHDPMNSMTCSTVDHKIGYGMLHRGQQLHGALPITVGSRSNLILWMRSSKKRSKLCPMCNNKPDLVPCSVGDYGDGFLKSENVSFVKNGCSVL